MDWRVWVYAVTLAALIVLYVGYRLFTDTWDIRKLWLGEDGRPSTSKFQFCLWFTVIFGAYVAVTAARFAATGTLDTLPGLDGSLLLALGFSGVTAVAAKQVAVATTNRALAVGVPPQAPSPGVKVTGGLATADYTGDPDLGKLQLLGWTLVGVAVFIAVVIQRIQAGGPNIQLPPIDQTLLLLMGLGQATYLGQKVAGASSTVAQMATAAGVSLQAPPVPPTVGAGPLATGALITPPGTQGTTVGAPLTNGSGSVVQNEATHSSHIASIAQMVDAMSQSNANIAQSVANAVTQAVMQTAQAASHSHDTLTDMIVKLAARETIPANIQDKK